MECCVDAVGLFVDGIFEVDGGVSEEDGGCVVD